VQHEGHPAVDSESNTTAALHAINSTMRDHPKIEARASAATGA
jgi:hypothetical protein